MRSPTASESLIALAFVAVTAIPGFARADDRAECSGAYDQTQVSRRAGKLADARARASTCARPVCAAFMRDDCAKWLVEIDATQPTLVVRGRDATGADLQGRVLLDGAPWLDRLDGQAKAVDPGEHTIRFEPEAGAPVETKLLLSVGEKNRVLELKIAAAHVEAPPPPASSPPALVPIASPPSDASPSVAPWILGGAGVAALVAGAAITGVLVHERSVTDKECGATSCSPAGESAASTGRTLGPIATVAFIVGGAAVTGAAVWLLARPRPSRGVDVGLAASPSGGALRLRGAW